MGGGSQNTSVFMFPKSATNFLVLTVLRHYRGDVIKNYNKTIMITNEPY